MTDFETFLTAETVAKYRRDISVTGDWVSYRYPPSPFSASLQPGRFNESGVACYYIASGVDCAQREVKNNAQRDLFVVAPTTIQIFDLPAFAQQYGIYDDLMLSKEHGGHALCQQLAAYLTNHHGISGILYESYQARSQGHGTGYCIAILPRCGQVIDNKFFIRNDGV